MPLLVIIYSAISILPNFIRLPAPYYPNLDKYYTTYYTHTMHATRDIFLYVHANELSRVIIMVRPP